LDGLHQIDPKRNRQRFYTLQLAPNLFGEWSLIRSWGRLGTSGQQRTSWHASPEAAESALQRTLAQKQRRGYRLRPGNASTSH
jgi:predicted DNA-binding WGR domain protein